MCKDTFSLVVDAMRAFWHLPITFDFFLSAHITSLSFDGQRHDVAIDNSET